ncbi:hypothetical protein Pcinc_015674 [Petrolisthes cinctipes]|uniref:WAP domain-containing protein n=1 Tax=Petrolisthes cinctipes TaxID=88211 RepID=A0AAE1FTZ3_PETCI|nr:hypothetical protein Pcinc_015674 [Petrolisthes cinctipes]
MQSNPTNLVLPTCVLVMTSPRKSIQQQDIINFVHLVVFPVIGYITGIKGDELPSLQCAIGNAEEDTQISFLFTCCLSDRHCPLGFTCCPNQDCLAEQSRVWLTEAAQMLGLPNGSQGDKLQSTVLWSWKHYPHLHYPLSLCITLQWSRRDGHTINLRGDTVLLHPGQKVPGRCRPLQNLCCVD